MYRLSAVFCALLIFCVGCGTKESPTPPVSQTAAPSAPLPDVTPSPAAQTVFDFMTAMLRGEDDKIRVLLTPAARKAGEAEDTLFSPPASDTATFTIDQTVVNGNVASVHATLKDIDPESGQRESSEIVWKVVQTEEGWRVSGALVPLFEGQPKLQLNFEDPDGTRQALADAEAREMQKVGNKPITTERR